MEELLCKENKSLIKTFMPCYISDLHEQGGFIFEHYVVFFEDTDAKLRKIRVETHQRANALALDKHGRFYRVWQNSDGDIKSEKCYIRVDRNIKRMR